METWLRECESNHTLCTPPDVKPPKRLIEVGSAKSLPRILDTSSKFEEHWRYATLSHCWGDYRPLTLTIENESSFMKEIPWHLLPHTFREALEITRAVGIPYLWIDSLCIAQDDELEWQQEAVRMRDVYSGSTLAICASDASNSLGGCFLQRDEKSKRPKSDDLIQFSIVLPNEGVTLPVRIQPNDVRLRREKGPLATRGWTLQEQLLPNRVLYCTRPETQWQCRGCHRTEAGVLFDEDTPSKHHGLKAFYLLGPPAELHKAWCQWMEDYSQRTLTFPRDRFAALAGIVQQYAERSNHKHLLGSWEETLLKDLLWIRCGEVEELPNMLPGVPSWSWLSRCKWVSFDIWARARSLKESDIQGHAEVVEVNVSWTGIPLLSDIEHTHLVLRGPVRVLKLRISPLATDYNPPYLDVNDEQPDFSEDPIPWRCAGQFDSGGCEDSVAYTCFLMQSSRLVRADSTICIKETFLILQPSSVDGSTNTYRRVGLGHFRFGASHFEGACQKEITII